MLTPLPYSLGHSEYVYTTIKCHLTCVHRIWAKRLFNYIVDFRLGLDSGLWEPAGGASTYPVSSIILFNKRIHTLVLVSSCCCFAN